MQVDAEEPSVDSSPTPTPEEETGAKTIDQANVPQERFNEVYRNQKEAERKLEEQAKETERLRLELELARTQASTPSSEPLTLESFDYDQAALDAAILEKKIQDKAEKIIGQKMKAFEDKRNQEAQERQQQKDLAEYTNRAAAYSASNPNFDRDIRNNGDAKLSNVLVQAIIKSPAGPQMEHFLMTNASERNRILALDPVQQAIEFGRLEARTTSLTKKNQTSAPPPVNVITPGGTSTASPYDDKLSMDEYRRSRGMT